MDQTPPGTLTLCQGSRSKINVQSCPKTGAATNAPSPKVNAPSPKWSIENGLSPQNFSSWTSTLVGRTPPGHRLWSAGPPSGHRLWSAGPPLDIDFGRPDPLLDIDFGRPDPLLDIDFGRPDPPWTSTLVGRTPFWTSTLVGRTPFWTSILVGRTPSWTSSLAGHALPSQSNPVPRSGLAPASSFKTAPWHTGSGGGNQTGIQDVRCWEGF